MNDWAGERYCAAVAHDADAAAAAWLQARAGALPQLGAARWQPPAAVSQVGAPTLIGMRPSAPTLLDVGAGLVGRLHKAGRAVALELDVRLPFDREEDRLQGIVVRCTFPLCPGQRARTVRAGMEIFRTL